ncbi:MAG: precorrin-8X methylmutase [Collinsella sp.]
MDSRRWRPATSSGQLEIITEELGGRTFPPLEEPVVKRVIHTTADFSYADSLVFTMTPRTVRSTHCAQGHGAHRHEHGARRHKQARAREDRLPGRVLYGRP